MPTRTPTAASSDDNVHTFKLGTRDIELKRPTTGQMMVIIEVTGLQDEDNVAMQLEGVRNFGTVVRSLFTLDEDRSYIGHQLAKGNIELEDYFELALDVMKHWAPETASNRAERRATPRKAPAKRAARQH